MPKYAHSSGFLKRSGTQRGRVEIEASTAPEAALEQIHSARRLHHRLGQHYDAIARIRQRLEHEPWEHRDLSDLCRKLRLPSDFDVFQPGAGSRIMIGSSSTS